MSHLGHVKSNSRPRSAIAALCENIDMRVPSLTEVLRNQAPPPYTLSAFMAFLSQNHCLETLEFILDASRYQSCYYSLPQTPPLPGSDESEQLRASWDRLIDSYIRPGAIREVNLAASDRESLLRIPNTYTPPSPNALDSAVYKITELMRESVLSPFLASCQQKMREEQEQLSGFYPQMMNPALQPINQLQLQQQQQQQHQALLQQQQQGFLLQQQQQQYDAQSYLTFGGSQQYQTSIHQASGMAIPRPLSARPTSMPSSDFLYTTTSDQNNGSDEDANMSGSEDPMTPPHTPPALGTSPTLSSSSLGGAQWKKTKTLFQKMGGSGRAKSREPN